MHRSTQTLYAPDFMRFYPRLLQEAGYYTSNNYKEDYNIQPPAAEPWRKGWNDSSGSAHWRNAPAGMPFFAVFNINTTHESRIRPGDWNIPVVHDPDSMVLPACHPDIPMLRESWAKHHDTITQMDSEAGSILDDLEADGLSSNTIVFFFGDHGSCIPGYKRFVGNRGQRTPLIIHLPPKYSHLAPTGYSAGAESDELVSFVDFAPTLLSLLDCDIPSWMHGRAFAGPRRAAEPDHLVGYIGRHDTRIAAARSVTDGRHVYIRNYHKNTPHGTWSNYTQGIPPNYATFGAAEWQLAWWQGGLSSENAHFFDNNGSEQLYDLETDPDETINLVGDPAYSNVLATLRARLDTLQATCRDGGLMPEGRLYELVRDTGLPPWDVIGNDSYYPYTNILDTANRAISEFPDDVPVLAGRLSHPDATIRLWAARGLGFHGREAVRTYQAALQTAANDTNAYVQVCALQALARHADAATRANSIDALFALCNRWGIVSGGVVDRYAEREIHFAGEAISHLPYLTAPYRALAETMNNETGLTAAYRRHVWYWFDEEYSHPLGEFRALHGLDKWGADDGGNPSGDGIANQSKYAYNMAPVEGDLLVPADPRHLEPGGTAGLPSISFGTGSQEATFQFVRRKEAADSRIQYVPEESGGLRSEWTSLSAPDTVESIDGTWERVSYEFGITTQQFMRVKVFH